MFSPEKCLLLTAAAYIQMNFRLYFFMETNNMIPDQTAPWEQSDLISYCLQYRLSKQMTGADNKSRDWQG